MNLHMFSVVRLGIEHQQQIRQLFPHVKAKRGSNVSKKFKFIFTPARIYLTSVNVCNLFFLNCNDEAKQTKSSEQIDEGINAKTKRGRQVQRHQLPVHNIMS